MNPEKILADLISRYPKLEVCRQAIWEAFQAMEKCISAGGCIFLCGNGGSASDAEHIAGELLKAFVKKRPLSSDKCARLAEIGGEDGVYLGQTLQQGLRAVSLMSQTAIWSAVANDLGGDLAPAQQLTGLGQPGDLLIGLTTSGNAKNVAYAAMVAKGQGMTVLGMTGQGGGHLATLADVCIRVPEQETFKVQELHLPVYHCLCMMIEERFF